MTRYATREEEDEAEESQRRRRYVVQGFGNDGFWHGPGGASRIELPPEELFDDDNAAFLTEDGDTSILQDDT
jgi:hypothetical protein